MTEQFNLHSDWDTSFIGIQFPPPLSQKKVVSAIDTFNNDSILIIFSWVTRGPSLLCRHVMVVRSHCNFHHLVHEHVIVNHKLLVIACIYIAVCTMFKFCFYGLKFLFVENEWYHAHMRHTCTCIHEVYIICKNA